MVDSLTLNEISIIYDLPPRVPDKRAECMRRRAVYYFRCKISADLVAHTGTKEITMPFILRGVRLDVRYARATSPRQRTSVRV